MDKIACWHFADESMRLGYGDSRRIRSGHTLSIAGTPECCIHGLHGSEDIIDALRYAAGPKLCRVQIWGDVDRHPDKLCGRHRHTIWVKDITDALWRFACAFVRQALDDHNPSFREGYDAIDARLAWLEGKVTTEELNRAARVASAAAVTAAENDYVTACATEAAYIADSANKAVKAARSAANAANAANVAHFAAHFAANAAHFAASHTRNAQRKLLLEML